MKVENIFIIHPTTNEEVSALKAFVKALKIKFEITTSEKPYNSEFVAKVQESKAQYKKGNYSAIKTEDLWK
jgi:hypothetical protein